MGNTFQREMTMREHTKKFYKVNLRTGYVEDTSQKTTRYINGLRMEIQDEINLLSPRTMEEAYKCALKEEEKILSKQNSDRGRGTKGGGKKIGRWKFPSQKNDVGNSNQQEQSDRKNDFRGGRTYQRGRGRGNGRENAYTCYKCNKMGHRPFECPANENTGQRGAPIAQVEQGEVQSLVAANVAETKESLMMKKIPLKLEKKVIELVQRKALFQTICKSKGKCCPSGHRQWKH